jgi:hypothetical protein
MIEGTSPRAAKHWLEGTVLEADHDQFGGAIHIERYAPGADRRPDQHRRLGALPDDLAEGGELIGTQPLNRHLDDQHRSLTLRDAVDRARSAVVVVAPWILAVCILTTQTRSRRIARQLPLSTSGRMPELPRRRLALARAAAAFYKVGIGTRGPPLSGCRRQSPLPT